MNEPETQTAYEEAERAPADAPKGRLLQGRKEQSPARGIEVAGPRPGIAGGDAGARFTRARSAPPRRKRRAGGCARNKRKKSGYGYRPQMSFNRSDYVF